MLCTWSGLQQLVVLRAVLLALLSDTELQYGLPLTARFLDF